MSGHPLCLDVMGGVRSLRLLAPFAFYHWKAGRPIKIAWFNLLVSAFTDFGITVATSLVTVMVAMGDAQLPSKAAIVVALLGAFASALRTVQQALKSTPEVTAALKGTGDGK